MKDINATIRLLKNFKQYFILFADVKARTKENREIEEDALAKMTDKEKIDLLTTSFDNLMTSEKMKKYLDDGQRKKYEENLSKIGKIKERFFCDGLFVVDLKAFEMLIRTPKFKDLKYSRKEKSYYDGGYNFCEVSITPRDGETLVIVADTTSHNETLNLERWFYSDEFMKNPELSEAMWDVLKKCHMEKLQEEIENLEKENEELKKKFEVNKNIIEEGTKAIRQNKGKGFGEGEGK